MVTITLLQRDTDSSSWADPFTILQYYEECQIQSAKCSALPHCKNGFNKPISPTWMWVSSFLPCLSLVIRTYQGLTNLNNWKRGNLEGSLILSWCTHSHGRDKTFADWFCHSPWIVELCSAEVFLFFLEIISNPSSSQQMLLAYYPFLLAAAAAGAGAQHCSILRQHGKHYRPPLSMITRK